MGHAVAKTMMVLAVSLGGGSLLLLAYFLLVGPFFPSTLPLSDSGRLVIDAFLCLFFFCQHSGMIRRKFKNRVSRFVPAHFLLALYGVASGVALCLLVFLWQPTGHALFRLEGPVRWLPPFISLLAALGFAWGVESLGSFDAFGTTPIRAHLLGKQLPPPRFVVRGPYRYVRHPLYLFMLVLFWSTSQLTSDRLLLNLLWTAWVVGGTYLEERDLLADFGESYRQYQSTVPMLLPWRFPRTSPTNPFS